jgi:hypothetical protein
VETPKAEPFPDRNEANCGKVHLRQVSRSDHASFNKSLGHADANRQALDCISARP